MASFPSPFGKPVVDEVTTGLKPLAPALPAISYGAPIPAAGRGKAPDLRQLHAIAV